MKIKSSYKEWSKKRGKKPIDHSTHLSSSDFSDDETYFNFS